MRVIDGMSIASVPRRYSKFDIAFRKHLVLGHIKAGIRSRGHIPHNFAANPTLLLLVGVTKIGSLRNIQLKRAGEVVTTFDLYDLLTRGDTSKDSRLLPGDVIFIPTIGKTVGVSGDVKRPAIYELRGEETVRDVLALAGGALPTAYLPATRIERITDDGEKTVVDIDASTQGGLNTKISDADVVQIFSTLDTLDDIVLLRGHVKRPGGFKWRAGMRFTDVVDSIERLSPNPDINVGLIRHVDPRTRRIKVSSFSPEKAWLNPSGIEDPILRNRDTVYLFSYVDDRNEILSEIVEELTLQAEFGAPRLVATASGSVRSPGEYPYFSEMTASQLIDLAGGLLESSSSLSAEITRNTFNHDHSREQKHFTFNLLNEDPKLLPGDSVSVKQIPYWKENKSVTLLGEVVSPGVYNILPGETLTQVIERAGGLTPYAYIKGTTYSRQDLRELEQIQLEQLKKDVEKDLAASSLIESDIVAVASEQEREQIIENIDESEAQGLLVINLEDILRDPKRYDFELDDGDIITVPNYKPTVTVVGEVQLSTSHFFDPKTSFEEYIRSSGGTKRNADRKRIYVVRANGQVVVPNKSAWFKRGAVKIQPGDTIVVPIDTSKVDQLEVWKSISSILGQTGLAIASITRI